MPKSHIAGWAPDSPTPAQLKEFFTQIEVGRITRRMMQSILHDLAITSSLSAIAREILGKDIIFSDEIAQVRGLSYSEEQLKHLADTLPAEDVLRWLKANNFAFMPGPSQPMSLLGVRSLEPKLFYSESGGWYADQKFAENDKTVFGWLAVRRGIFPNSTDKTGGKQIQLLMDEEYVPNAAEFAWFVTTYYKVRGVRLFKDIYARTSSVDSVGRYVSLGLFDWSGLDVYGWYDGRPDGLIGLASARKS